MKNALVVGASGQDGAYLCQLLLSRGYQVTGTSRSTARTALNHETLGISQRVPFVALDPSDYESVVRAVRECSPHEIYNLSGQSSVGVSFEKPVETLNSIVNSTTHLLEAIRSGS